jgi:hypothetical protein
MVYHSWGKIRVLSKDSLQPKDIAAQRGHTSLAVDLEQASVGSLWEPTDAPRMASSNLWSDPQKQFANQSMSVGYAGGVVIIDPGTGPSTCFLNGAWTNVQIRRYLLY